MMKFLKGTQEVVLRLRIDTPLKLDWYWDSSFAVHEDFKSHTGGALTLGKGAALLTSKKQKLSWLQLTMACH